MIKRIEREREGEGEMGRRTSANDQITSVWSSRQRLWNLRSHILRMHEQQSPIFSYPNSLSRVVRWHIHHWGGEKSVLIKNNMAFILNNDFLIRSGVYVYVYTERWFKSGSDESKRHIIIKYINVWPIIGMNARNTNETWTNVRFDGM